jgi:hypothetical protein
MNVYMSCAALLCADCGEKRRTALRHTMPPDFDQDAESTYDSDHFPKGPYANGGGEADTPQHCDACGLFLENPLTPDGDAYVREQAEQETCREVDDSWEDVAVRAEKANRPVLAQWIRFYFAWGQ